MYRSFPQYADTTHLINESNESNKYTLILI